MSTRLGIALRDTVWTWALVEHGWRSSRVVRAGEVEAGAWDRLARDTGTVRTIGVAVPDRRAVLRRIRIGHPPKSRVALRRLLRWRLKDDLPFDAATVPLDGIVEDEHAIALAVEPALVAEIEARAASLGAVERVTSIAVASFNAIDRGAREADYLVVEADGHASFSVRAGRIADLKALDGAPASIDPGAIVLDIRGAAFPRELSVAWAVRTDDAIKGRAIAAAGAAL